MPKATQTFGGAPSQENFLGRSGAHGRVAVWVEGGRGGLVGGYYSRTFQVGSYRYRSLIEGLCAL